MSPNSTLLVIGHSFIRRLRDFLAHSRTNGNAFGADLDLRDDFRTVIFHGVGGMTLDQLRAETDLIKETAPQALVIQIGTNDLAHTKCNPVELANDIIKFAQMLVFRGFVSHVVIGQILPRVISGGAGVRALGSKQRPARHTRIDFNEVRLVANDTLRLLARHLANVHFWPHRGMFDDWHKLLDRYGLHLNNAGQRKYARSIRGAAMLAQKCARGVTKVIT